MMAVDFVKDPWLRGTMDDDKVELKRRLYTQVGMAMEDASIVAINLGSPNSKFDTDEIAKLETAVEDMARLLKAARSIVE